MNGQLVNLLAYILISVVIRLPFFFRDYIDRDESTFIIMGQSWVDGFLPYTQLWDLKPPLVFLFFAIIIQFFGKSYIAIRLFGALVIAFTAFFIYKIGTRGADKRVGFFSGVLYIYLSSLFGSLQGVMSEHLAMFFFVLAFWRLLETRRHLELFLSAVLFGTALMFRLNLVYPVGFLFIYYLLFYGRELKDIFLKAGISLVGGLLVPFLTFLPYLLRDIPLVWWNSVVLASMNYDNPTFSENLEAILQLSPFLLLFVLSVLNKNHLNLFNKEYGKQGLIWVVTAGLFFMLIKSGKVNSHYLIQIYPFLILLVVAALSRLKRLSFERVRPYLLVLFLFLPVEAYLEYGIIGKRYLEGRSVYNGYGITIPDYIEKNYKEEVSVFFLDYHIGYWELAKLPPRKVVTHPSNLLRKSNYPFIDETEEEPLRELKFILEQCRPQLIVSRSTHISFSKKNSAVNQFFEQYLKDHYRLVFQEQKAYIYERNSE